MRSKIVIGWRLMTETGEMLLMWADQDSMPGIRIGERFVPPFDRELGYATIYPFPKDSAKRGGGAGA